MNCLTQSVTVDRRASPLRFGAIIAVALMLPLAAFSTSARAGESRPTIVLVHGAFARRTLSSSMPRSTSPTTSPRT